MLRAFPVLLSSTVPYERMEHFMEKILVLDDGIALLPGHGPQTSVGWERRRNPFLQ